MNATAQVRKRVVSYAAAHKMSVEEAWEVLGGLLTYGLLYTQTVFLGTDATAVPKQAAHVNFDWWNLPVNSPGMSHPPECSPISSTKSAGCVEHTEILEDGQKNPYYGLSAAAKSKGGGSITIKAIGDSTSFKASGGALYTCGSTKEGQGWASNAPAEKWATALLADPAPLVNPIPSVTIKLPNTYAFKFSGFVNNYSDGSTTLSLSHQDVGNLVTGLGVLGNPPAGGIPDWARNSDGLPSTLLEKKILAFGVSHLKSMSWAWKELALSTIWPNYLVPVEKSDYGPSEVFMSMASYHWDDLAQFLALRGCHMTSTNLCSCVIPEVKPKEKEPTKVAKGRQVVLVAEKEGCSLTIPKGFRTAII